MSFGFSVGDFLAVGQLSWKVYKSCKDSPGDYVELSTEVGNLHNVVKETEELLSQQVLTPQQEQRLLGCQRGCEEVLKDLDRLLVKYESLGTKSWRTFDRMGFGTQDMSDIRLRLVSNVSMLDAFNNTSSNTRLEKKLDLLIAEVRAGKREGSVISTQTFDTTARNDQETWEALRRELEDIGISPGIITEKRQFIIAWFQEAVAAGKLEEDVASDDNDSAISLDEPEIRVSRGDDDSMPSREMSSGTVEPSTAEERATPRTVLGASRPLRQTANRSSSPPPQQKENSRMSVAYLQRKLKGKDSENSKDSQFLEAAIAGDALTLKRLLDKGVNIQTRVFRNHGKSTALHLASSGGKELAVRGLLSEGADVNAKDENGKTALHEAVEHGHQQVVDRLLKHEADIESKNSSGITTLTWAAAKGQQDTVRLPLEQGADIKAKDLRLNTALRRAAERGQEDMVRLLLEQGANIESKDSYGKTALLWAAGWGQDDTVRLLLERGADIESEDSFGQTALIRAAAARQQSMVGLLLKQGADIESKDSKGRTALIRETEWGHEDMVGLLLEHGANIESKCHSEKTALMLAAERGHYSKVQLLLDKGANPFTENSRGRTARTMAYNKCHFAIFDILLEAERRFLREASRQKESSQPNAAD